MQFVDHRSYNWTLLVQCGYTTAWVVLGIACMLPPNKEE